MTLLKTKVNSYNFDYFSFSNILRYINRKEQNIYNPTLNAVNIFSVIFLSNIKNRITFSYKNDCILTKLSL